MKHTKALVFGIFSLPALLHIIRWIQTGVIYESIMALLFVGLALLYHTKRPLWMIGTPFVVLLSQTLFTSVIGTVVNCILLVIYVCSLGIYFFEKKYIQDVTQRINALSQAPKEILREEDIAHLPKLVQQYLIYTRCVGKEKLHYVHLSFTGEMRSKGKPFFPLQCEQYNFFDDPARLFFMKGTIGGITVPGYHRYVHKEASIDIRLCGIIPVVKVRSPLLTKAETVTLFNDMCLMAPASLIDSRITWDVIDKESVRATFHHQDISISALLYFNEDHQLIQFISDDRIAIDEMKSYRFSTPVSDYTDMQGVLLPTKGSLIWHYPEGEFEYGRLTLTSIAYNKRS